MVTTAPNLSLVLSKIKSNPKLLLESSKSSRLKIKDSSRRNTPIAKKKEVKQANARIIENFKEPELRVNFYASYATAPNHN